MSDERQPNSDAPYSYLGLPDYMGRVAQKALTGKTSRVLDMDPDSVRPTHISHLALVTSNFDAVAGWWQTVLNAKPSMDAPGMRFMAIDGEHHRVVVFENPTVKRRTGPVFENAGMHHIAFSYAGFKELATTYQRLKKSGILPWRGINHGTSFALDYHDPDFNTCELQCSCFPGVEEREPLNEWLETGAFNRNPIGVMFDMEEAIAAYERGVDLRELLSPYVMRVGDHTEEELKALRMAPVKPKKGGK